MTSMIGFSLAAVVVLLLAWRFAAAGLDRLITKAQANGEISGVVEAIARRPVDKRPTAYNYAIRRLWNAYDRGLATELVKVLAREHHDTRIAQYWLNQVVSAEPAIARQALSQSFLEAYFVPEVAKKCGPVG